MREPAAPLFRSVQSRVSRQAISTPSASTSVKSTTKSTTMVAGGDS
jgi:hypothetical protein